jgi:transposase
MDVLYPYCAGIDVHKKTISVCVLTPGAHSKAQPQIRECGTTTRELLELADWLLQNQVTHIGMESTGVYWKPIWNILEAAGFTLTLANAQHVKNVPGKKTDTADCVWLAQLLRHGLLPGSFVPEASLRELRDLTRARVSLVRERAAVANRIQKTLEDANIKLGNVVSDILGGLFRPFGASPAETTHVSYCFKLLGRWYLPSAIHRSYCRTRLSCCSTELSKT